ncbi:hypothetical protein [Natronorubrum sp. FCH18a]|uniref:hypothetical protein n=1 Tax=Natronorubrum sp. FCH18a TaxID=3447018 RepID=UPI003F5194DE
METSFREWLRCPACEHDTEPSVLAFRSAIVLECYDCGLVAEFEMGDDVPFQDLDRDAAGSD